MHTIKEEPQTGAVLSRRYRWQQRCRASVHLAILLICGLSCSACSELRLATGWCWGMVHNLIVSPYTYPTDGLPDDVVGVRANGSIVWTLPVDDGVVLIDAGFDESGDMIRETLKGQKVLAIVLTHSHLDHISAINAFGDIPVYVGADDYEAVGTAGLNGVFMIRVYESILQHPPAPQQLIPVDDGECVLFAPVQLCAIKLPGHTPGGIGWHFKNMLFSGDVLVTVPAEDKNTQAELDLHPLDVDIEQSARNYARLLNKDLEYVLDGHWGIVDDAHRKIESAYNMHQDLMR